MKHDLLTLSNFVAEIKDILHALASVNYARKREKELSLKALGYAESAKKLIEQLESDSDRETG